jgi:hypothetical protein
MEKSMSSPHNAIQTYLNGAYELTSNFNDNTYASIEKLECAYSQLKDNLVTLKIDCFTQLDTSTSTSMDINEDINQLSKSHASFSSQCELIYDTKQKEVYLNQIKDFKNTRTELPKLDTSTLSFKTNAYSGTVRTENNDNNLFSSDKKLSKNQIVPTATQTSTNFYDDIKNTVTEKYQETVRDIENKAGDLAKEKMIGFGLQKIKNNFIDNMTSTITKQDKGLRSLEQTVSNFHKNFNDIISTQNKPIHEQLISTVNSIASSAHERANNLINKESFSTDEQVYDEHKKKTAKNFRSIINEIVDTGDVSDQKLEKISESIKNTYKSGKKHLNRSYKKHKNNCDETVKIINRETKHSTSDWFERLGGKIEQKADKLDTKVSVVIGVNAIRNGNYDGAYNEFTQISQKSGINVDACINSCKNFKNKLSNIFSSNEPTNNTSLDLN